MRPRAASTFTSGTRSPRVADVDDVVDIEPPLAHGDAGADERAHHAVAERVGPDVGDEHAVGVAVPVELEQRADRRRLLARLAVGGEVVQPDEPAGRGIHRSRIERRRARSSCGAARAGRSPSCVGDAVLVATPHRREAGVEALRGRAVARSTIDVGVRADHTRDARARVRRRGSVPRVARTRPSRARRACWSSSRSTCATCPVAWTPASVRPATTSRGSPPRIRARASSRVPCTVRSPGWRAQPRKFVPS